MLVRIFLQVQRLALLVAIAVSLTATAFAHRAPSMQDGALAFVIALGDDFCGGEPDDGLHHAKCLACQIASALDLPPAGGLPQRLDRAAPALALAPQDQRAPARVRDPGHSPQAPPAA